MHVLLEVESNSVLRIDGRKNSLEVPDIMEGRDNNYNDFLSVTEQ